MRFSPSLRGRSLINLRSSTFASLFTLTGLHFRGELN